MIELYVWTDAHRTAVEFDLMRHGRPFREYGPGGTPWHDAWVILKEQDRRGSALFKAQNPKHWEWMESLDSMLLAALVDLKRMDMWGQADPKKRGPQPDPIPRPGVEQSGRKKTDTIGKSEGVSKAEFERRIRRRMTNGG